MKFIAYDLGTGGVKASLYDEDLKTLSRSFIEYETFYPKSHLHEQKPSDWWKGITESTYQLLKKTGTLNSEVKAVALSGHSCVAVPLDKNKIPLLSHVPIWSDTRAVKEANDFFTRIDYNDWYMTTGNGFPPSCYALFKLMWYQRHMPDLFRQINLVLGSKDYINFLLTGNAYTDHSYASSSGGYDLINKKFDHGFLEAAGIPEDIFPPIVSSHHQIGTVTKQAARETGLAQGTVVACGGVDNACMALGAVGPGAGSIYTSLGSSSWVPVNSAVPILDPVRKPYVFAHIEENMFTSAFSIFAGGSSFRWIRETLCRDLPAENIYHRMASLADKVPIGSHGLIFNPSLAGGTSQDESVNIQGAFLNITLSTTREDMIRAAMEGIAMNLQMSIEYLKEQTHVADEILFCGGGSKSDVWMQMFAEIFDMEIIKSNIDQDAASVGAAAICARAMNVWKDYSKIKELHKIEKRFSPNPANAEKYRQLLSLFSQACHVLSDFGDYIAKHDSVE